MSGTDPKTEFLAKLQASLAADSFVRLALSGAADTADRTRKVSVRLIELRGERRLSFTVSNGTREETRNEPVEAALGELRDWLGRNFQSAMLQTTQRDWQLHLPLEGKARLIPHKASHPAAPARAHDQGHAGFLDAAARDWLQGLEILDGEGRLRARMADKHRQVAHYLEIFSHLAKDCGWDQPGPAVTLADMGCGKGYLTFGLWHLFERAWHRSARIIGAEVRPELCQAGNALANRIGAAGLEFKPGTIASLELPQMDGLIALHACNTATDEAMLRGIELQAKLIVVAPCCHQEVRPQLGQPEPLAAVLRHGLMAERMAEWTTDGLRALFLEWAGYRVKMIEFIASEHTPKNLMIAAVKAGPAFAAEPARQRIRDLKTFFGIEHHALDSLLERR